jgi:hypothetical protein
VRNICCYNKKFLQGKKNRGKYKGPVFLIPETQARKGLQENSQESLRGALCTPGMGSTLAKGKMKCKTSELAWEEHM